MSEKHQEHDGAAVRIPPPFVYLAALPLGVALQAYVVPLRLPLSKMVRIGGAVALVLLALGLMAAAAGMFKRIGQDPKPWKPTPAIVSTGVYGFTRNPMYVSMGMLQAAIGVAALNGWIVVLLIPVLALVYVTAIRHEEAYLERKFGETYLAYKRSVRRWI